MVLHHLWFCIDACPVGNEPMVDILRMRQDLVLMESKFPRDAMGFLIKLKRTEILGVCLLKIERIGHRVWMFL